MVTQILTTKLFVPPLLAEHVSRPRLVAALNNCYTHNLTLVSAPAGYGKTTLLSHWARGCTCPLAWLTLDPGDDDPARFTEYLFAAFRQAGISIEDLSGPAFSLPNSLTSLINSLNAVAGPVILILDDYHQVSSRAVHSCLAFLLDHQPPHLHIIISTRADPPLPLARLRARRQLAELRLADLRFTDEEAGQLLDQIQGSRLSQADTDILLTRTEGWAAGLQMAAAAVQTLQQAGASEHVSRFIQAFSGSNRYILDYLMEEVLSHTSQDVRSFLYQTAILNSFSADLCAEVIAAQAVTQEGIKAQDLPISPARCQSILESLEQANLFILSLDPDRKWYRYHPLFADLLQKRLKELAPSIIPELAQRASWWFDRQGWVQPAVDYAFQAQNFSLAAGLLQKYAENLLMRGELVNFSRWTHALPEDVLHLYPLLTVFFCFTLAFDGVPEAPIERHLHQAESSRPDRASRAAINAMRTLLLNIRGEYRAGVELARQALKDLPTESVFIRNYLRGSMAFIQLWEGNSDEAIRAFEAAITEGMRSGNLVFTPLVMRRLARLYIARGQLKKGSEYLEQALRIAVNTRGDLLPHAGMILVNRGDLKREWNDLDAAEEDIRKGIQLMNQWGKVRIADAYVVLAEVLQSRGDWQAAREAMDTAVEKAHQTEEYEVDDMRAAYARARLAIFQGDLAAAEEWARSAGLEDDPGPAARLSGAQPLPSPLMKFLCRVEYLVLARLRLAQNRPDLALKILNELIIVFEQEGWVGQILEAEILRAMAYHASGDRQACQQSLQRALEMGYAGGYFRLFIDEGSPMQAVLQAFLSETGAEQHHLVPYIHSLLDGFRPPAALAPGQKEVIPAQQPAPVRQKAAGSTQPIIEPLSERELEILRLLSTYLTVPEIAGRIGVSTSTVRTHTKHIYEKLGVHSRIEAVERARERNLS